MSLECAGLAAVHTSEIWFRRSLTGRLDRNIIFRLGFKINVGNRRAQLTILVQGGGGGEGSVCVAGNNLTAQILYTGAWFVDDS